MRLLTIVGQVTCQIETTIKIDSNCNLTDQEIFEGMKNGKLSSSIIVNEEIVVLESGDEIGSVHFTDIETLDFSECEIQE